MSNKLKILFTITLLCSVLFTSVAYADAPNGVSNNLQLWLKADVGISETDGQTITNWQDQSPNAYSATNGGSDGQTAPTFKNNSLDNINFNPIVEFDGVANGLDLASNYIYSINDGLTFFAVVKPDTEPNEGNFILDFGRTVTDGYGFSYANDTFRLYTPTAHGGVNSALTSHAYDTDSVLYTGKIDFANEQRIYLNGTSVYNENISLTQITTAEIIENPTHASGQKGPVTIGRQAKPLVGNDRLFAGKIAEIILYDTDLSDADRNKVQSYLAIKYGLTLDNSIDYVNASGLYIYPSTLTHSTHTHDIAVIGAETVSGLSQSKSRSVNSDSVVTIEGSSIGDGNFLAWGNDDDALTFTATDTPYGKRLERDWKTSEVGAIGFVTVSFDLTQLSGMGLDITDATKYRLLIDDNGDFSDAIEASGGIISSNTISFSNVSLASTVYFSLAFDVPTRTTYNFNSLTLGDVNGQDDWERTNTGNQPGGNIAIVTEGFDSSNNLKQTTAGNSTTSIASHANLGNLTFFPFVEEAIYAFEFEQQGNCWGQRYGLAYDQNANGEIGATESTEQAIVFQSGACVGGHKFITPSGSVITSTTGHQGGWARFRVIVDLAANSGQGNACVVYKNLTNGDTDWQSMGSLQNVNLGLDSSRTANDRTNPQNWDSVFFWSSGDASWLDNLAFDDAFTLNDADVSLSNSNVSESVVAGTVVGNIEVTTSATYTYSLVAGTGDTDNALFTLDGNQLKTNAVLDYEAQPTRSIRVQVKRTDSGDCAVVEKIFTIAIDNVNETPVAGSSSVLDFDGSDDYVDLGILNGEILGSNARTIEAWVKTTSTATSSIFRYGASAANGRINLRTTDGEIIIEMSGKQTIWSAPNINDGNWHHVAWSYTAGTNLNDGIAYVDGVQLTTQTGSGGTVPPNTQTGIAQIGRRDGDVSLFYFDGQIDEVRLWNTTRTQAEIQANMYTALTGSELGLVSYWNFEEATGTLLNDLNTSSANNGTLTNMDSSDWILDVTGTVGHNLAFTTSISAPISDTLPAYDGDNDTLTYILVDDNSGATVLDDISTGAFTYTPASTGTHTFTYKVNDGAVDSNIVTVTIEVEPNAPPVAGFGSALDFDGVDDYVEIPNSTILQLANTITLEAWINVGSTPSCGSNACSDQAIIGNGLISEKKYLLDVHGGDRSVPGKVEFGGSGLSTPWLWSATASGVVDDNTWHHIAATYDGSEKKIYIDGELSKAEATTGNFETTTNPFYIGGLAGSRQTNGIIDEARVWNIARTQAEIQADMYQALQGDEPNLVGYWPFDEGAGTTAHDETNNSNDGTLTNNPIWVNSAIPISFTTSLSTPISDTLPAYDNEGNTLTYSLVDNNGGAAVLDNASTGAFTYIPASAGTHTFTYKVNDGFDDSNIATVTIEVEPNVAPIAGFATGLDFDGVDDKISITGIDIANQSFTLEFWGKRDTAGNNDYVFGQGIGAANLGLHFGWWSSGEVFQFAFYSNDLTSDTSYVDTNWHHWAGTYDATTKLRTLYRDGIKVAQDTAPADYQGSGTFYIGAIYSSDASLDGKLDEVRIWNTARSEEQIADNYALALKGDEAGLMGYWSFNTGSGSTAIDSSGNNRDGTLNNMDDADWIDINSTIPVQFTTSLSTPFSGLLPATDADGGTLTYSLVNDDSGAAVLTDTSTGAFTYTPHTAGTRTFTYKVNDGFDDSNIATVTINVTSLVVDGLSDGEDGNYTTGQNSLHEAITNANVGDTITFDASLAGQTINLDTTITIDKDVNIDGGENNISLSGQDLIQIFNISAGTVVLSNLTLKNGRASAGGAIEVSGSGTHVTAQDITFDSNHATGRGGAIRIIGSGNTAIVERSTFVNNSASTSAGGLRCAVGATAKVYNSTFFNNSSTKGAAVNTDNCNLFEIYNSTLHANTGNQTLHNYAGNSTFKLYNTIISSTLGGGVDCNGGLSVKTNTLIQDGTCGATMTGDPKLSTTLADNDGTTQTLALLSDSPAINAGDAGTCEANDQRGISRTAYDICDIGAYELILTPTDPSSFTPIAPTFDNLASGIALSWVDSLYEDEYLLSRDGADIATLTQDTISYTDTAISCGLTYTYSLKAKNSNGESNTISTAPIAMPVCPEPVTPTDFVASIPSFGDLDPEIGLSWTDNNAYEDNYILSRGGSVIATLNADTSSYKDDSVNCDATYNYSLKATNGFGESDSVSVTAVMPACPLSTPNEPINFVAVPSYNQVTLNWTDGSSLESGYKILRDGVLIDTLGSDIETYTDKGLHCETTYSYEIYAYNSAGDSIIQTLSVTTEACPSLVPGNLSAIVTADSITLVWEDVEGETGYLVTRESLATRRTRAVTEFNLPADSTTFTDSGFECGQSYDYAVAAVTDTGVSEAASITVNAEACATLPLAPNQLIAESITYASISLRWSDNSDNETGFYISHNSSLAKNVSENSESATIRDLECETSYTFQVTAYNSQGQANSETISVTTAACPLVNLVAPSHFETGQLSANQIRLTWNDNSLNETGFPIARNGEFITIAPINAESFIDNTVTCGTDYIYHLYVTDDVLNLGGLEETVTMPACLAEGNFYVHLNTVGSGIINNCHAAFCSLTATGGTTINLVATANEGWQFSHWSGDCTGSQLLVDAEKNCLAHFVPISVEPTPEPTTVNPYNPTITGAVPVPNIGADLCGTSFTNHNATTGNLNICETGSVSGGNLIGDNVNAGLVSNFTLNENSSITGGRLSGFNTNNGTLQDLTITPFTEVTGGFYAGSINNNGTIFDPYIEAGSTVYSSTGQGSIIGITQNKGTIQGKLKLGVDTTVIGGKISGEIIAPAKSPAYIGQAEILAGSTLQNVYLSPTVQLPRDVTLINVKQASNPAEPSLDDFGVKMDQLDDLDARSIVAVEPAAIALFDRYEITSIPTAAFAGMTPDQVAAFAPETLSNVSVAQFEQLPPEALAGFTADNVTAFSPEVMQSLTPEQLQAFNPEAIQQAEQVAKLLTNIQPDTPQELINKILPQSWEVSSTGKIIPAVGSKLSFKGLLNRLPSNVLTPYLVDFQSSFSIGGEVANNGNSENTTVGGGFNVGLQQTPTIDSVDLDQFIFTQNEYGIFNVVGTGDYEGIVFAFMPNANNIEQAPLDTPVGLTTIEGGYFEMTTPDKQKFVLVTAPNNPVGLQEALGGESEIKLSPTGDVLMRIDTANTRSSRNLRFETDVMLVGTFDAFVEPAPDGFCLEPEFCEFGMEFPSDFGNLRARQEAKVIYPDGSAQTIYPTVIYPETLVNLLEQYDAIPDVLYKADGTFETTVFVNGQKQIYNLTPNINVDVRRLEAGEKRNPKVSLQGNTLFYEVQEGDDLLIFSLNIEAF